MTVDDKDFTQADKTETPKVPASDIDKLLDFPPKPEERPLEEKGVVIETRYTRFVSFCKNLSVFCAALLAGLSGVWLWSVLVTGTGLDYLKWTSILLIPVAAAIGYIINFFAEKPSWKRSFAASLIALAAICTGKALVARSIILPGVESYLRNGVVTVGNIKPLVKSPRWMFVTACRYSADKYDWDKSFTRQVIRDYLLSGIFGRSLPYKPSTKVVSTIKQINETIAALTDSQKRLMVKAAVNDYRDTTNKPSSLKDSPILNTAQIKGLLVYGLTAELVAGQETPSLRMLEYIVSLVSSFYWFDLIIFSVCLWVAYRINS